MAAEGRGARLRRAPEATVVRLPVYQRALAELVAAGATTVSSQELAARAHVNAAKVRKDLSLFGSFGTRGTGYDAAFLAVQIDRALGADRQWPVVIVGIGNLGRALANSDRFSSHGFFVSGLYDVDAVVVGTPVAGMRVRHLEDLACEAAGTPGVDGSPPAIGSPGVDGSPPAIGIITTPASSAQSVASALVDAGASALLNFAPRSLAVPPEVLVRNVDLSIELQVLSFFLAHRTDPEPPERTEQP